MCIKTGTCENDSALTHGRCWKAPKFRSHVACGSILCTQARYSKSKAAKGMPAPRISVACKVLQDFMQIITYGFNTVLREEKTLVTIWNNSCRINSVVSIICKSTRTPACMILDSFEVQKQTGTKQRRVHSTCKIRIRTRYRTSWSNSLHKLSCFPHPHSFLCPRLTR